MEGGVRETRFLFHVRETENCYRKLWHRIKSCPRGLKPIAPKLKVVHVTDLKRQYDHNSNNMSIMLTFCNLGYKGDMIH